jgi:hypothetical protein
MAGNLRPAPGPVPLPGEAEFDPLEAAACSTGRSASSLGRRLDLALAALQEASVLSRDPDIFHLSLEGPPPGPSVRAVSEWEDRTFEDQKMRRLPSPLRAGERGAAPAWRELWRAGARTLEAAGAAPDSFEFELGSLASSSVESGLDTVQGTHTDFGTSGAFSLGIPASASLLPLTSLHPAPLPSLSLPGLLARLWHRLVGRRGHLQDSL